MAMRPRSRGGHSEETTLNHSQAFWPVFEDFNPMFEWLDDNEADILIIYLPGFMIEQIKVSIEGWNSIRVHGERPIAENKWSRFLEDFEVPENSDIDSVSARFQGGILHITIPKQNIIYEPREATLTPQPLAANTPKQSDPKEGHNEVPPPPLVADGKSLECQTKASLDSTPKVAEKTNELKDEKTTEKKEKTANRSKELPKEKTTIQKDKESKQKPGIQTSRVEDEALVSKKYKKAIKGLAELNEERPLLVNMGVVVLVIVAISACAAYKFTLGKDKN